MMRRVVGIDLSLTKTGIGVVTQRVDGTCVASGALFRHTRPAGKAKRAKLDLPAAATLAERHQAFTAGSRDIRQAVDRAELVVIYQGYTSAPGQGDQRHDVLAMWWSVVGPLLKRGVPVAELHDTSARKALTGKGAHGGREANKVATALAVRGLWPDVELESDDVADALGAAHLGAVALGWDVETLARHREVKWGEWPVFAPVQEQGAA